MIKKNYSVHIGTSGWSYDHWKKNFYPENIKAGDRLHFYSTHFDSVEINSTFYRLPLEKTLENWYRQVPKDFIYALKASQYITHRKRLKDPEISTTLFFERIALLKEKAGPILFQLPPSMKADPERLESFIKVLKKDYRYAFEFRHNSWFQEETYSILKKGNCALCLADFKGNPIIEALTADFIYIRLHGPQQAAYQGSYSPEFLSAWAQKISEWSQHYPVYCYFDNDEKGYAVQDAQSLKTFILK